MLHVLDDEGDLAKSSYVSPGKQSHKRATAEQAVEPFVYDQRLQQQQFTPMKNIIEKVKEEEDEDNDDLNKSADFNNV